MPSTIFYLYLIVAVAVISGIRLLSSPEYARWGNIIAAIAMLAAIVLILAQQELLGVGSVAVALLIGSIIGAALAIQVKMIQMPQLVAFLNGCGGAASCLVSLAETANPATTANMYICGWAVIVGSFTFSGSLIAVGKLSGKVKQQPVILPHHSWLTSGIALILILYWAFAVYLRFTSFLVYGVILLSFALALGVIFTIRIGGADMPVVICFLNALSGLAASLCGFVTQNPLLVACGAMVGASGILLSQKMCRAMNRNLANVFLGLGVTPVSGKRLEPDSLQLKKEAEMTEEDKFSFSLKILKEADEVIIAPGYGMALSQAQFKVWELAEILEARGARVRFAIHPVAGRMPGHMNVLLAEAGVPYDKLLEMDAINEDFKNTDVAVTVGACDVVNPSAIRVAGTPISGMPILKVFEAENILVCNLNERPGYSGVENPLYKEKHAILLWGDAKETLDRLIKGLSDRG